jgi:hypothetical protein
MRKLAHALAVSAALALLTLASNGAEAQRGRAPASGMDWESGQFLQVSSETARAPRSQRTRSARANRRGGGGETSYGSLRLASLTGTHNVGPRPRNWCGWWMRTQLGGGPEYNLAWNWRRYGSPASPQVGAVVVWRGHVGMIVGEASNGKWLVRSGNWGGRVATVARSVRGAVIRI